MFSGDVCARGGIDDPHRLRCGHPRRSRSGRLLGPAASAGSIAVSELFAAEGAPNGVRSNAVCPGAMPPSAGTGLDVAAVVAWLASDESSGVNGATLRVDSGTGAAMVQDTRS